MTCRLVSICSLEVTETVFGKVLMQSAADLGLRYRRHQPSWQMRARYRADIMHVVQTVIQLSSEMQVKGTLPLMHQWRPVIPFQNYMKQPQAALILYVLLFYDTSKQFWG